MNNLITILGPTASGKTNLACALAFDINGEIISADSRQFYVGMDIGTGKDIEEYTLKGKEIPYHLIDIKPAGYQYNIYEYQTDFLAAFKLIEDNSRQAILCGGSGLYLETALSGNTFLGIPNSDEIREQTRNLNSQELLMKWSFIPPKLRSKLDSSTDKRIIRSLEIADYFLKHPDWKAPVYPEFKHTIIGVDIERDARREKITNRLSLRLNNGLIEEVENLLDSGLNYDDLAYYGLEYKWICQYLKKQITKTQLFDGLNIAIHQFSKRQMTWFRRMEKHGYKINWIDTFLPMEEKVNFVKKLIK